MAETTFEMTPTTLARAVANGAARQRTRAAKLVDDRADVALGAGDLPLAQVLTELAELIRSSDPTPAAAQLPPEAPPELEQLRDEVNDEELPPVRHFDDYSEGVTLVRTGAAARGLRGYNGASGHLRD